jgi:signal peptidase I
LSNRIQFRRLARINEIQKITQPKWWQEVLDYLVYFFTIFLIISCVYTFVRFFAFDTIQVQGESMYPYHTTGDLLYLDVLTQRFSNYRRGEIIVLRSTNTSCNPKNDYFVKRIIGLPGEKVIFKQGKVYILNPMINPNPIKLDESSYLKDDVKTFKNGEVEIEGATEEKLLGADEYYFMGDNRPNSKDGRVCGPIKRSEILGREFYQFMPSDKQKLFTIPKYNIPNI